jgi:hypothetical protein
VHEERTERPLKLDFLQKTRRNRLLRAYVLDSNTAAGQWSERARFHVQCDPMFQTARPKSGSIFENSEWQVKCGFKTDPESSNKESFPSEGALLPTAEPGHIQPMQAPAHEREDRATVEARLPPDDPAQQAPPTVMEHAPSNDQEVSSIPGTIKCYPTTRRQCRRQIRGQAVTSRLQAAKPAEILRGHLRLQAAKPAEILRGHLRLQAAKPAEILRGHLRLQAAKPAEIPSIHLWLQTAKPAEILRSHPAALRNEIRVDSRQSPPACQQPDQRRPQMATLPESKAQPQPLSLGIDGTNVDDGITSSEGAPTGAAPSSFPVALSHQPAEASSSHPTRNQGPTVAPNRNKERQASSTFPGAYQERQDIDSRRDNLGSSRVYIHQAITPRPFCQASSTIAGLVTRTRRTRECEKTRLWVPM